MGCAAVARPAAFMGGKRSNPLLVAAHHSPLLACKRICCQPHPSRMAGGKNDRNRRPSNIPMVRGEAPLWSKETYTELIDRGRSQSLGVAHHHLLRARGCYGRKAR